MTSSIVSTALTKWKEAGDDEPAAVDQLTEAAGSALEKADIQSTDLDAIICNTTALPFDDDAHLAISSQHFAHRLADQIGTHGAQCINVAAACASASIALSTADAMIRAGNLETVLVGGVDNSPEGFYYQGPSTLDSDLTVSYPHDMVGITNPGYWAMWARRRAHEMDTSIEDIQELMALVKEMQSQYGAENPAARFDQTFSKDQVLDSPMVCDPLRLYMISSVSNGAGAAVVTSKEKAKELTDKPVDIAASEVGSPIYSEPSPRLVHFATAGGERAGSPFTEWRKPIEAAYNRADVTPDDVDIIECHDTSCFHTINWIDQIMGWERERTDQLIRDRETTRDGELPVNLSGGTASFGEAVMSQGTMMVHELVQQLRGDAGSRQATNDPETGICTAYGAYGSYGATLLESGWD